MYNFGQTGRQLSTTNIQAFSKDNLSVYEFVEELSKDHSNKSREVNSLQHLDPKPFIRTFESTLRELNKLSLEASARQTALEKEVSKYELDHSRNILSLSSRTESVKSQFKKLDDEISSVNSTINPLTEELTRTLNSKERSIATIKLIQIYTSFYHTGNSNQLDHLAAGNIDDKRTCATTVAQLLTLSSKLSSDDFENSIKTHELIQKYSEIMETSLLEDFNNEYKQDNFPKMKEIADILTGYNGGDTVIKNFVNQHTFFLNTDENEQELEDRLNDEKFWDILSDPITHDGLPVDYSARFYKKIKNVIQDETIIILEVFENPIPVLILFIQRIFIQQIQSRMESLLKISYSTSTLAYLRTLHSLYISTGDFTRELTTFFHNHLKENHNIEELITLLDQSYNDAFIQHLGDSKYLELEKKTLESIFYTITSNFETLNESKINKKLSSRIDQSNNIMDDVYEYEKLNRRSRVGQFKNFMRHQLDRSNSFKRSSLQSSNNEDFSSGHNEEFKLNINEVELLLKSTVESLSRMMELNPLNTAENGLEIFEILLIGLGKSYVDIGLEISYNELHNQDYRLDYVNFDYLDNVAQSSEILLLISTCIRTIVLPSSNNSPQIRQRIINLTNGYVSRVELSINIIAKDTLNLFQEKIIHSLSKQKKKDFLPKIGELSSETTIACESLTSFLEDSIDQIKLYLNGSNLTQLLNEIGNFTFTQLFAHFQNFQINSTGGIIATTDIISYQSTIETWNIPELTKKFQLLREIANLFTVQPDLINSLTKDGQLVTVKPYILRQFIQKRSDYSNSDSYLNRLVGKKP
ncbi:hypothetical protein WICMUC_002967 [Wickerhamomyces mucosus]|uniref:Exocyst complex component Sec10 n=1 Tax=Wickerhamomyces mucosus TaxID=1378264 RepID=A0A9P8PPD8_9ASCO|nr:hypothetical protein WICMUC_002967 [Wickerhamomyces mucosus]